MVGSVSCSKPCAHTANDCSMLGTDDKYRAFRQKQAVEREERTRLAKKIE